MRQEGIGWLQAPSAALGATEPSCRCCGGPLGDALLDLGLLPARPEGAMPPEAEPPAFRPLRVFACLGCRVLQIEGPASAPAASGRSPLDAETPVLDLGAPGLEAFAPGLARRLRGAGVAPGLIRDRGALALAPDPHEILAASRILLAPGGVLRLDLPCILTILRDLRFDAIGPERPTWLSLAAAEAMLAEHGLALFDIEPGEGTLRLLAGHAEDRGKPASAALAARRRAEAAFCLPPSFRALPGRVLEAKCGLLDFLVGLRRAGRSVAGFGAGAAPDRLLRHAGIGPDLLPWIADDVAPGAGALLPACRVPVRPLAALDAARPDFILLLRTPAPDRREALCRSGARLVEPLPALRVLD
ncbi:hypothetical protein [Falsiroseomonas sp. HW251]|uniref:hypothetical protein n=1 Tax=Falsiroseomonas sp. HW251 TaxID=3390998 RepID=UPI003D322570